MSASRWTRLGGGVTAPGPPPGRGAGRPGSHLASPRGPAPVTPASRSDRGGRREAAWAPRGRLHTRADEASVGFPGLPEQRAPERAGGCRQQRFILSVWRLGAWAQGPGPPQTGSSRAPSGRGCAGGPGSARLWLRDGHPCLHRRVASLPLGKVSVLRPPSSQKDPVTGRGAITSSKASLPKNVTCMGTRS